MTDTADGLTSMRLFKTTLATPESASKPLVSPVGYLRPWIRARCFSPGRPSDRERSPEGDPTTESWIVILSHAYVVKAYHNEFGPSQKDVEAAQHDLDVAHQYSSLQILLGKYTGLSAEPSYLGPYLVYLKQLRIIFRTLRPKVGVVTGSSDFNGMNTYTTNLDLWSSI
ncbi:hypothetical protein HD554DRAFT_1770967 [Boletus coccyginus]|nr:hypothetical protein HD554DRAFT_1770967 [Boletus coccyginus]